MGNEDLKKRHERAVGFMLQQKIAAAEAQMRTKLEEVRAALAHAGSKGSHVEETWRTFLREYLPRRLEVGHGEVIDSHGNRSAQTDIVIVNEDHPFTFTKDQAGLFFIEGICAAGEVKSILTKEGLAVAATNARQFRALKPHRAKGTLVCANISDRDRSYTAPPFFLVVIESKVPLETVADELSRLGYFGAPGYPGGIDGLFLLDRGWVIDFGDGKGTFQFRSPNGESSSGWVYQESTSVLFNFLGWLSSVMLRTIRFEPILPRYLMEEWP